MATPPAFSTTFEPCPASKLLVNQPKHDPTQSEIHQGMTANGTAGPGPEFVSAVVWVDRLYEVTDQQGDPANRFHDIKSS